MKKDLEAIEDDDGAYNDVLNFSSELEFDEKFIADEKVDHDRLQGMKFGEQGEIVV